METVCEVPFNIMTRDEARRAERVLRDYLLRTCDQVSMIRIGSSYLSLFNFIPHPIKFRRFKNLLKEGDVARQDDHSGVFNLTENIKKLFNLATLFFDGKNEIFYGFTDPKFLHQGKEVASMLSNEKHLTLYISDSDKAELSSKGVFLDNPEIM